MSSQQGTCQLGRGLVSPLRDVGMVRHKLAFHYDDGLVRKALANITRLYPDTVETMTMGHAPVDWYFGPGALVNERIAIRDVFNVPEGGDVNKRVNALWDELFGVASAFTRFAGHFAWQTT